MWPKYLRSFNYRGLIGPCLCLITLLCGCSSEQETRPDVGYWARLPWPDDVDAPYIQEIIDSEDDVISWTNPDGVVINYLGDTKYRGQPDSSRVTVVYRDGSVARVRFAPIGEPPIEFSLEKCYRNKGNRSLWRIVAIKGGFFDESYFYNPDSAGR